MEYKFPPYNLLSTYGDYRMSLVKILRSNEFSKTRKELPIALGNHFSEGPVVKDIAKMPHLLIAGSNRKQNTSFIYYFILSLLYTKHPSELKFVMINPINDSLKVFEKIKNLFIARNPKIKDAIIEDNDKACSILKSLCTEMDNRYDLLQHAKIRNIKEYNQKFLEEKLKEKEGHQYLPYIVVFIDELVFIYRTSCD